MLRGRGGEVLLGLLASAADDRRQAGPGGGEVGTPLLDEFLGDGETSCGLGDVGAEPGFERDQVVRGVGGGAWATGGDQVLGDRLREQVRVAAVPDADAETVLGVHPQRQVARCHWLSLQGGGAPGCGDDGGGAGTADGGCPRARPLLRP